MTNRKLENTEIVFDNFHLLKDDLETIVGKVKCKSEVNPQLKKKIGIYIHDKVIPVKYFHEFFYLIYTHTFPNSFTDEQGIEVFAEYQRQIDKEKAERQIYTLGLYHLYCYHMGVTIPTTRIVLVDDKNSFVIDNGYFKKTLVSYDGSFKTEPWSGGENRGFSSIDTPFVIY